MVAPESGPTVADLQKQLAEMQLALKAAQTPIEQALPTGARTEGEQLPQEMQDVAMLRKRAPKVSKMLSGVVRTDN